MRKAKVFINESFAGDLWEDENGYHFLYDTAFLNGDDKQAVSLTLPLQQKAFTNEVLFPFFDGLIPEGWLLDIVQKNWKINPRDRFGILLATGKDCIGNVSIIADE